MELTAYAGDGYEEECEKSAVTGKQAILGHPGIYFLSQRINDYFSKEKEINGWHINMAKIIIDNFEEYKNVLFYHLDNFLIFSVTSSFLSVVHIKLPALCFLPFTALSILAASILV